MPLTTTANHCMAIAVCGVRITCVLFMFLCLQNNTAVQADVEPGLGLHGSRQASTLVGGSGWLRGCYSRARGLQSS